MARLTTTQRRRLPARDFAIPERRAYPIPDEEHARWALDDAQGADATTRALVRRRVFARYPWLRKAAP
jgi:hypothetical protein